MSTVELGGDLGIESTTELKNRLAPWWSRQAS
jgi:hypothetical protein